MDASVSLTVPLNLIHTNIRTHLDLCQYQFNSTIELILIHSNIRTRLDLCQYQFNSTIELDP